MEEINQTKEGFIKSMILFVVLLGICFAPFFAFSQIQEPSKLNSNLIKQTSSFPTEMNKRKTYSNEANVKVQSGAIETVRTY